MEKLLNNLRSGGAFVLLEYELDQPRGHWIPYPIPFLKFQKIADQLPLIIPMEIARLLSVYGNNYIYLATCLKV